MVRKFVGIVLREVPYRESSSIISVLTEDNGIMGFLALGCKRKNSHLGGVTAPLTYGEFCVNYRERGLCTLIEVGVINSFLKLRRNLVSNACSLYLLELAGRVYEQEEDMDIFEILIKSLVKINDGVDAVVMTLVLSLKFLKPLGITPNFNGCVECGNTDVVTLSSYKGGFLCVDHLGDEKMVDVRTLKIIRMLYYIDIDRINSLDLSGEIVQEIVCFISDYYDRYSGIYLKSKDFLQRIIGDIYE